MKRIFQFFLISTCLLTLLHITYANENRKIDNPALEVRFPIIDKGEILTQEQKEHIFDIYSDFECYSFIQISLLVVNSPNDRSGKDFLTNSSGNLKDRIVIRLVTSTKEVELFWKETLDDFLQKNSNNYKSKFEPYLSNGNFYEAALYGSIEIIKTISPGYSIK